MDGDHRPDLLMSEEFRGVGDGAGRFITTESYPVQIGRTIIADDFNRDKRPTLPSPRHSVKRRYCCTTDRWLDRPLLQNPGELSASGGTVALSLFRPHRCQPRSRSAGHSDHMSGMLQATPIRNASSQGVPPLTSQLTAIQAATLSRNDRCPGWIVVVVNPRIHRSRGNPSELKGLSAVAVGVGVLEELP